MLLTFSVLTETLWFSSDAGLKFSDSEKRLLCIETGRDIILSCCVWFKDSVLLCFSVFRSRTRDSYFLAAVIFTVGGA